FHQERWEESKALRPRPESVLPGKNCWSCEFRLGRVARRCPQFHRRWKALPPWVFHEPARASCQPMRPPKLQPDLIACLRFAVVRRAVPQNQSERCCLQQKFLG